MEIVYKKLNEIRPYTLNARKNQKTVELLVKIIEKVGFDVPIVIDKKGVIVKGHARFYAAIRLGMKEVPCIVSEASDEENKLDRLADNLISEFSLWVTDDLLNEIRDLDVGFDLGELNLPNLTTLDDVGVEEEQGRPAEATERPLGGVSDAQEGKDKGDAPVLFYKVVCPDCGYTTIKRLSEM